MHHPNDRNSSQADRISVHCITGHIWKQNLPTLAGSNLASYMGEGRKEMFSLTTHSTHFMYGYMASDILIVSCSDSALLNKTFPSFLVTHRTPSVSVPCQSSLRLRQ